MSEQSQPFAHMQDSLDNPRHVPEEHYGPAHTLPPVFQFSQQSLQAYMDCARRFQLRYVEGQRWPAAQSEPLHEYEALLERGSAFHMLVQRHLLGIPAEQLTPDDPDLAAWWQAYLDHPPKDLPTQKRLPEVTLSTPMDDQRLLAKFDLLALEPGKRAVIVDWKTTKFRPKRADLAQRLQSRVYPFVLVEAGAHLFGGPIKPEQVTLIYWFAEEPERPEIFDYTADQHEANRSDLMDMIKEISGRAADTIWPLTMDMEECRYCIYRSLCGRGVKAGPLEMSDVDEAGFDFDLDDIEEIAF